MTSTSAQIITPYVDMSANGQLVNQQGGTYSTLASTVSLSWFINDVASCELKRSDTGTSLGSYSYTSANYGTTTPAQTVTVSRPSSSIAVQTIPYSLRCATISGTSVSDSLQIEYTNTNIVIVNPPVNPIITPNPGPINHNVDLAVDGQLSGQYGGAVTVASDHTFILQWTASNVASCRLRNTTTNTTVASRNYNGTGTISDYFGVVGNPSATANYSRSYQITCYDSSGANVGNDTVTVNVTVPSQPSNTCPIEIDYFDVDQDDVYEDEVDDDVRLSWASTSPNSCSHACTLTYEGNTYSVTNNNSNRPVNNIDNDHTFVLECYQVGNPSNSVTSTEHVDYHSGGSSSNDEDPELETLAAQQIGSTSARIRGSYNDGDCSDLETGFLFGTQSNNLSLMNGYSDRSGSGVAALLLQGLTPGTTYYYRHVGDGCSGISNGSVKSFTTTGSSVSYAPYTPPQVTTITTTTGNSTSQQISVQDIAEDGTLGEAQFNVFDIGVGYVPESNVKVRGKFPSSFGDWLLILGLIGLLVAAGKFINDAMTHPHDRHKPRY